jgi:hypothetical protein
MSSLKQMFEAGLRNPEGFEVANQGQTRRAPGEGPSFTADSQEMSFGGVRPEYDFTQDNDRILSAMDVDYRRMKGQLPRLRRSQEPGIIGYDFTRDNDELTRILGLANEEHQPMSFEPPAHSVIWSPGEYGANPKRFLEMLRGSPSLAQKLKMAGAHGTVYLSEWEVDILRETLGQFLSSRVYTKPEVELAEDILQQLTHEETFTEGLGWKGDFFNWRPGENEPPVKPSLEEPVRPPHDVVERFAAWNHRPPSNNEEAYSWWYTQGMNLGARPSMQGSKPGASEFGEIERMRAAVQRMRQHVDRLPGGLADRRRPENFDPGELQRGISVEMEHTADPTMAQEIAMDHLAEDPEYYQKLARMEGGMHETVQIDLIPSSPVFRRG